MLNIVHLEYRKMEKDEKGKNKLGSRINTGESPVTLWLNGRKIDSIDNIYKMEFHIRKEMTDAKGLVHNGILCVYTQDAIQKAFELIHPSTPFMLRDFQINFISQPKLGDKVYVLTKLKNLESHLIIAECHIECGNNLIARASCSLCIRG